MTLTLAAETVFSQLRSKVLKDIQIADRISQRVTKPAFDPFRRECVEYFAIRFRKIELALPDPRTRNGEIVGDRRRELVDGRLILTAGRQSREVAQQHGWSAEERQSVVDCIVQGDPSLRKTPSTERLAPNRCCPFRTGQPESCKCGIQPYLQGITPGLTQAVNDLTRSSA